MSREKMEVIEVRPPRQRKDRTPQQNRNDFGRYLRLYCAIFETNETRIAEIAGIDQSTLSLATKGTNRPRITTVEKVWNVLVGMATEQGGLYLLLVSSDWQRRFYNAARWTVPMQEEEASGGLHDLQRVLDALRYAGK